MATLNVPVDAIVLDSRLQMRAAMDFNVIDEYAEHVDQLPPCRVFQVGEQMLLTSGWHRFHARKKAGKNDVPCEVMHGTFADALLDAAGQNHGHGIRRTNEDKRRAVGALLGSPEFGDKSDRMIAKACHVSDTFVASIRREDKESQTVTTQSEMSGAGNRTCERCQRIGTPIRDCPACAELQVRKRAPASTPKNFSQVRKTAPERRTGADGKSYPATRPKQKPPPVIVEPAKPRKSQPITDTRCKNLLNACGAALSEEDADKALELAFEVCKRARELALDLLNHPTLEEVQEFITESKIKVDAEAWLNHYQANGWMVGKQRMRDWRACVRQWGRNSKQWAQERNDGKATGRVSSPQSSIDAWERKAARTRT